MALTLLDGEVRWDILNALAGWVLMGVLLVCMAAFLVCAARVGLGLLGHSHHEVVRQLTMPLVGWGIATAAAALAWSIL